MDELRPLSRRANRRPIRHDNTIIAPRSTVPPLKPVTVIGPLTELTNVAAPVNWTPKLAARPPGITPLKVSEPAPLVACVDKTCARLQPNAHITVERVTTFP